jgi:uncharacterized membrane protein YkvA (DUF1232 family)
MRRATLLSVLSSPRAWARFFRDKDAPKGPKVLAVFAVLYVLSPIDVLPDFALPIVGLLDDLGVAAFASAWLASIAARYENNKPEALPPSTPAP